MTRILDNDLIGDEGSVERTLRPQYLREYIGQDRVKDQLMILLRQPRGVRNPWIMSCYLVPQAWVKQRWPLSLPMNWEFISSRPLAQPLKSW